MEHNVAFMIGISALVVGFSFLIHPKGWSEYLHQLRKAGTPAALVIGYLHLLVGSFIVGFHWKWTGLPLLLTLLGVKALLEGVTYTIFPKAMQAMLAWYEPRHRAWFPVMGILTMVIGGLVLYEWWQYMQQAAGCVTWHPCFNQASNI